MCRVGPCIPTSRVPHGAGGPVHPALSSCGRGDPTVVLKRLWGNRSRRTWGRGLGGGPLLLYSLWRGGRT